MKATEVMKKGPETGRYLGCIVGRKQRLVADGVCRHEGEGSNEAGSRRPRAPGSERLPEGEPRSHVNQHVEPHQARDADGQAREGAEPGRPRWKGQRTGPQARPEKILARNLRHEEA